MKFGAVPVGGAAGSLLAHSVKQGDLVLRKGHRLAAADVLRLAAVGVAEVVVARLGPDDVHEDEAARRLAEALTGTQVDSGAAT